jgi:hypothetical protein
MSSTLICSKDYVEKNDDINNYPRKYVETVKASYKEKEIGK